MQETKAEHLLGQSLVNPQVYAELRRAADGDRERSQLATKRKLAMIGTELPCNANWKCHRFEHWAAFEWPDMTAPGANGLPLNLPYVQCPHFNNPGCKSFGVEKVKGTKKLK